MSDIEIIRNKIKGKTKKKRFNINKFLIIILLTLSCLILLKSNKNLKEKFYKYVFEDHISFQQINKLYQKYFKEPIPKIKEKQKAVFDEKLSYKNKEKYLDGVKLEVDSNLISALESGMVVFIGEKEALGNTVIIEQINGVEVWYSNIKTNLKMYDYIDKGATIGEVNKILYLTFKKDGNILNYEDYI